MNRPVLAVALVGAAGTLPLHVLPLLVQTMIVEHHLTSLGAGSIAAMFSIGQLAATLALPSGLSPERVRWAVPLAATALVVAVLATAVGPVPLGVLRASWFVAGMGSGALMYVATHASIVDRRPEAAVHVRILSSLAIGGAGALLLGLAHGRLGEGGEALALAMAVVALTCTARGFGTVSLRETSRASGTSPSAPGRGAVLGMALLALLFAGQVGIVVHLVQHVVAAGTPFMDVVLAMAACKIAAALVVARLAGRDRHPDEAWWLGALLAASVFALMTTSSAATLALALLVWEVCLNRMSSGMQIGLARLAPGPAGPWIAALTLGGAAAGPALHGAALDHGIGAIFVAFAMTAAIAAGGWVATTARATRPA